MTLVDPSGSPVTSRELVRCPQCGDGAESRSVVTAFGGWWRRVCLCGFVYDKGQGLPPLEED